LSSITSGASELICALGEGDIIVGRDSYSRFPSLLNDIPEVAKSSYSPDIDLIVAQHPDIVIASSMLSDKLKTTLESHGIPVIIVSTSTPDQMVKSLSLLGEILNKKSKVNEITSYITKYLTIVSEKTNGLNEVDKPYIFWEWYKPYKTCNSKGVFNWLITKAGGLNIAAAESSKYPQLDADWLVNEDPDIFIKNPGGTALTIEIVENLQNEILSRPKLENIAAIANEKVYFINSDIQNGIRSVVGLLYMAKLIHPDLFSEINPVNVHQKLVEKFFGEDEWANMDEIYFYPAL